MGAGAVTIALAVAGCGQGEPDRTPRGGPLSVYSSLPRMGVSSREAEAVAAGERLALADAHGRVSGRTVRLVELDSAAPNREPWDPAAVEENARRARDDPTAVAYVGELGLGASAVSVPVTSGAGLLQVSPADGLTVLTRPDPAQPEALPEGYYPRGRRNFVRLVPTDSEQAAALVAWARDGGARRLAIVRDDRLFGRELAAETGAAATRQHVTVAGVAEARRDAADYAGVARDVAVRRPDAIVYTGLGDAAGDRVLAALRRALPRVPLYGSSALAASPGGTGAPAADVLKPAAPASRYGPAARAVLRRLRTERGAPVAVEALYGYGAMRVVLDALRAAAARVDDRAAVVRAALRGPLRGVAAERLLLTPAGVAGELRFAGYRRADGRLRFLGFRRAPGAP